MRKCLNTGKKIRSWNRSSSYLGTDVCPEDTVLGHVEVKGGYLLDAGKWDGHVMAVGAEGDAPDVSAVGKQQKCFRNHAGAQITQELQTHGTRTGHAPRPEKTQVTAAAVSVRTAVSA